MYEPDFEFVINNNEVLLKHIDLLKALSDDRIMCVGYEQNGNFYLMECCDEYFYHDLTKEECIELSQLFYDIARMIPNDCSKINLVKEIEDGLLDVPETREENSGSKWWLHWESSAPNGFAV